MALFALLDLYLPSQGYAASDSDSEDLKGDAK